MKHLSNYVKFVLVSLLVLISSLSLVSSPVFADTLSNNSSSSQDSTSSIPLEITPQCSDSSNSSAYWQVNNKNTSSVSINWTNIDNGHTGTYNAAPGLSQLVTYFDNTDPNNTTSFSYQGNTTQTNATEAACSPSTSPTQPTQPTAPTCIDGNIQQNLLIDWVSPSEVTVQTVNDAPLCNDVTIDLSSYIMPSDYNGQGFFTTYDQSNPANNVANPTAYPQIIYDNDSVTLTAGTDGLMTLNVNLPNSCNNVQVDVYYAPVQPVIGEQGSGTANIASEIYPSTGNCCPPSNPGNPGSGSGTGSGGISGSGSNPSSPTPPIVGMGGGNDSTSTTTTPPAVTAGAVSNLVSSPSTSSPAELAYTGESPVAPYLTAIALLSITSTIVYSVRKSNV